MPKVANTHLLIAGSILALTLAGYFLFPGHTYLQSDTQVYAPMLERLWDPGLYGGDFMLQRPHMAFTVFDEVAVALRRLTGLGFEPILTIQQLFFRALGLLGIFLIAGALKLNTRMALLTTAVFGLGATIWGPTVLTIEYEPIPRAFAVPLLLLALGLLAHGRNLAAGLAASLAFLYHPTTALPFWAFAAVLACWPAEPSVRSRRRAALLPLALAAALLLLLARLQAGPPSVPILPGILGPEWERVLRLRATYIWVSLWFPWWYWHYAILWGVSAAAFWRLRRLVSADLRVFLVGLPLMGMLSIPASYLLLEVMGSALGPGIQPTRALLFVTAVAGVLSTVAAIHAARAGRRFEAFLWFLPAFIIPTGNAIQHILLPDLADPLVRRRLLLVVLLAACAALVAWADAARRAWRLPAWGVLALLPFLLYPGFARVDNYPQLHSRELDELAEWARASTAQDAVFLFPDAGRGLYPGIFRARALRAVYVDWKSGGQGNYVQDIAKEWWTRWWAVMAPRYRPDDPGRYRGYGVDYVVVRREHRTAQRQAVFENPSFVAYRIR